MKKLIITLLCLAVLAGGGWFGYNKYKTSKDKKKVVDVVPVSMMAEPAYYYGMGSQLDASLCSGDTQKIFLDSTKLVKKVCVKEGDSVRKGDTILEYDMTVVELQLDQKENAVKVAQQSIKTAERELARLKALRPSEEAPAAPEEPDIPEEPEEPEEPEMPEMPEEPEQPEEPAEPDAYDEVTKLVDTVTASFSADTKGTADDPFIINCKKDAKLTQAFFARLKMTGHFAQLRVYDDDKQFLYMWIINPEEISMKRDYTDASVSDGVTYDEQSQMFLLDTSKAYIGMFSVAAPKKPEPQEDIPAELTDEELADFDIPDDEDFDIPEEDYDIPEEDYDIPDEPDTDFSDDEAVFDENYMYPRAELAEKIKEEETEIKQLKIDLKQAKLEYEQAKKRKEDGKVTAQFDGVVKKIGDPSEAVLSGDEDIGGMDMEEDMDVFSPFDDTDDDNAFAIISAQGGALVEFNISELKLDSIKVGEKISVTDNDSGAVSEAEITEICKEPLSYTAWNWGDNPNASTYKVRAELFDSEGFGEYDWLGVSLGNSSSEDSDSVYLPIHYVRKEGSSHYIMRADKNGKLEKHYVKTGKVMYGYMIEITAGLSMQDKICFPYGKDVAEGVKTRDTETVLYPKDMY